MKPLTPLLNYTFDLNKFKGLSAEKKAKINYDDSVKLNENVEHQYIFIRISFEDKNNLPDKIRIIVYKSEETSRMSEDSYCNVPVDFFSFYKQIVLSSHETNKPNLLEISFNAEVDEKEHWITEPYFVEKISFNFDDEDIISPVLFKFQVFAKQV